MLILLNSPQLIHLPSNSFHYKNENKEEIQKIYKNSC